MTTPPDMITLYTYIFVAGFAATYLWRFLGLVFAQRLDAGSEALVWVRLVAGGLMSALAMRMLILPPGALADTDLTNRLIAFTIGMLAYWFLGKKMAIGVFSGLIVFLLLETYQNGLTASWFN